MCMTIRTTCHFYSNDSIPYKPLSLLTVTICYSLYCECIICFFHCLCPFYSLIKCSVIIAYIPRCIRLCLSSLSSRVKPLARTRTSRLTRIKFTYILWFWCIIRYCSCPYSRYFSRACMFFN